jgi:hypothetical protein
MTFGLLGYTQVADTTAGFTMQAWMIQVIIFAGGALIFWGAFRQRLITQDQRTL